ncbi:MAG: T9SS type A sorting domain-containing protein [bacterium]
MKKVLLFLCMVMAAGHGTGQPVNGIVYSDTLGLRVIKVWGTHQQRGYALGYLTGASITAMMTNYIKPQFGAFYSSARQVIIQGNDIAIPQLYQDEAQAVIDGMNASGTNPDNLDKTDVLVGNSLLDLANVLGKSTGQGCASLMSWNNATAGTDLDGKSVVSRHLDWIYSGILVNNQIMVVHFPSEQDEKKWMLIGYAGMISALSGINEDYCAFQHVMNDYTASGFHGKQYLPVWLALRKALEADDYNSDGSRDVQDVQSVLRDCTNGFASGYVVSSLGRSNSVDSLVAMVAELTPTSPTHTFRYNDYDDNIPGDNLYASNFQIKRNDARNYDSRYNSVKNNIGNGTMISLDSNWNILRDHSHQSINMQFMQFAPEYDYFRIAIYRNGHAAYLNDPAVYALSDLFADPTVSIEELKENAQVKIYPNPSGHMIYMSGIPSGDYRAEIFDLTGKRILFSARLSLQNGIDISSLNRGIYTIRLTCDQNVYTSRFVSNAQIAK